MTGPNATHIGLVAAHIMEGDVIPFLGAGADLVDRPPKTPFELGRFLPNGRELAEVLAKKVKYPDETDMDLLRVSQYVDSAAGEEDLYKYLRELFNAAYPPSTLHRFLAKLPARLREVEVPYQLIATTNYDFALETAFDEAGEEYDVVWYEAKGNESHGKFWHRAPGAEPVLILDPTDYHPLSLDKRTVIFKLHGAVDPEDETRDSFVITEDDYIKYLSSDISSQIPAMLKARMANSHFLFLGYSMRDWNLRVILTRIWGARLLDKKSWAVQLCPDSEAQAVIEELLWRDRGDVTPLYSPLRDYVARLEAAVLEDAGVVV